MLVIYFSSIYNYFSKQRNWASQLVLYNKPLTKFMVARDLLGVGGWGSWGLNPGTDGKGGGLKYTALDHFWESSTL